MSTERTETPDPTCLECGYNLRALTEHRCPECGRAFDPEDSESFGPRSAVFDAEAAGAVALLVCVFWFLSQMPRARRTWRRAPWEEGFVFYSIGFVLLAVTFGLSLSAVCHSRSSLGRIVGAVALLISGVLIAGFVFGMSVGRLR